MDIIEKLGDTISSKGKEVAELALKYKGYKK